MRNFEITTLSDHRTLNDPITIIGGTIGLLGQIFPGLNFGGRNASQIAEDERRSMLFHKAAFLRAYNIDLSDNIVVAVLRPGWDMGEDGTQLWNRIMVRFYNENKQALEDAKSGKYGYVGGTAPGGIYSGLGFDFTTFMPFLIGGVVLLLLFKKK